MAKSALIVDDSRVNRNILMSLLEEQGYKTSEASDGEDGFAKFKSIRPQLTFLDIILPKLSGMELLKKIKSIDPNAKVVMVSSYVSREVLQEAKKLHADWFVKKPYDEKQISEIIKKFTV